jgi:hypothetical protein
LLLHLHLLFLLVIPEGDLQLQLQLHLHLHLHLHLQLLLLLHLLSSLYFTALLRYPEASASGLISGHNSNTALPKAGVKA